MQQDRRSAPPSKGEIAFRFVACTGIALALYYTPELRWEPAHANDRMASIDAARQVRAAKAEFTSCTAGDLVDAAAKGN